MSVKGKDIIDGLNRGEEKANPEMGFSKVKIEGTYVEILVDGITVKGEITHRERQLMSVTIRSPYDGATGWTGHIPLFALGVYNIMGVQGEQRAMQILNRVYRFCCYAEENRERLLECLEKYKQQYQYLNRDSQKRLKIKQQINDVAGQRSDLKKALKAGKINNKEYQMQYMPLTKKMHEMENSLIINPKLVFQSAFCGFWDTPLYNVDYDDAIEYLEHIKTFSE